MASIKNRRNYKAEFKAKVAMEAVAGRRTINEIAKEYELHPNQISQWKKQFLEAVPHVFENGKPRPGETGEELTNQLYEQIGRLKVELDWLKKKSAMFG
jgi:transposase-like protein